MDRYLDMVIQRFRKIRGKIIEKHGGLDKIFVENLVRGTWVSEDLSQIHKQLPLEGITFCKYPTNCSAKPTILNLFSIFLNGEYMGVLLYMCLASQYTYQAALAALYRTANSMRH